ncbi:MAG: fused MFS/spermidine synthase [Thermoguttaceae bacterium]|nr:fused MFS/spermidine synthase [Thermoguttaceae bacterium]MDW8037171.1 fused MFS/spermidine synthase [Thermoguttaceae bacterium]
MRFRTCTVVIFFLLAGTTLLQPKSIRAEKVLLEKESHYHYIRVVEEEGVRRLQFRRAGIDYDESAIDLANPARFHLYYYRLMMAALVHCPEPKRVLFVGLGGGTLPIVLRKYYPDCQIDSIELDPAVVEVARQYFGFREDERMQVYIGDGRVHIRRFVREARSYDLVFLDAFRGGYIPYHLTTKEFMELVHRLVGQQGSAVANLRPGFESYHYQRRTIAAVFANQWSYGQQGNVCVVANSQPKPPTKQQLLETARRLQKEKGFLFDLPALIADGARQNDYQTQGPILTDDYAPAELLRTIPKE